MCIRDRPRMGCPGDRGRAGERAVAVGVATSSAEAASAPVLAAAAPDKKVRRCNSPFAAPFVLDDSVARSVIATP